jgi:DMSO/TMAO reductase YedYZ molybdopterin-dependent catalytic subunit
MKTESDPGRLKSVSRRELLKLSPLLVGGVLAIPSLRESILARGVRLSDWASGKLFRGTHLAQTLPDSEVTPLEKFPYNTYDEDEPNLDFDNWKLEVSGLVERPGRYTLAQVQALPRQTQNTRHVCVEGWDVVGSFGGVRLSNFLSAIGADASARFVAVECADDYYESIDMACALHPQSLLCYEMYGKPLERGHGAPLRLSLPTKLGYKHAKYLTQLEVTNVLKPDHRGYWEDQGYPWFAGL